MQVVRKRTLCSAAVDSKCLYNYISIFFLLCGRVGINTVVKQFCTKVNLYRSQLTIHDLSLLKTTISPAFKRFIQELL
jgi:hypothetical protein